MDIRQAIKDADDLPLVPVVCSAWAANGWDGTVYVRTMKGSERDEFEHIVTKGQARKDNRGLKLRLALLTVCDDKGQRIFEEKDSEWLQEKSAVELDRIANASLQQNGFSDKDVAELEKN